MADAETCFLGGIGVGTTIGVPSVLLLLGAAGLPVSVASASSNAYIVVSVLLSTIALRQPLTRARGGAIAPDALGLILLSLSAG